MELEFPAYYQSFLQVQDDFRIVPDQTRRLPAVLEHLIKPQRLKSITEELSRLNPKEIQERLKLLEYCFDGIGDLKEYLLDLFERFFGEESPLNGCARDVRIAAAAAIVQAFPYEGLASFNPSIVAHPGGALLEDGSMRVILTVRSYGEYHRSSISFRTGTVDGTGRLSLDEAAKTEGGCTVTRLPEVKGTQMIFPDDGDLNSFVLYGPFTTDIGETWEDVRFTPFVGEGEYEGWYLGTFTSFNFLKRRLTPAVLLTRDFRTFDYHPLRGSAAEDKDIAYFPKQINGRYTMLSRNDGRDLHIMTSDDPFSFKKKKKIAECRPESFDAHKMGVCAPPIETEAGWLVIYHGVADPGQIYSLGVMLLDLEDPSKVIARLPYTLHSPFMDDCGGMLSHIHYTCGAMIHEPSSSLILPYALNDTYCKVGRIGLDELLARLMDDGR